MAPRGAMPISSHLDGEQFDPETQRIIGLAFELTRAALRMSNQDDIAPEIIAKKVIELAKGASAIQSAFAIMRWSISASVRIYKKSFRPARVPNTFPRVSGIDGSQRFCKNCQTSVLFRLGAIHFDLRLHGRHSACPLPKLRCRCKPVFRGPVSTVQEPRQPVERWVTEGEG